MAGECKNGKRPVVCAARITCPSGASEVVEDILPGKLAAREIREELVEDGAWSHGLEVEHQMFRTIAGNGHSGDAIGLYDVCVK